MCANLRAGVTVGMDACVIHENLVYGQSQQVLINAAAETDRHDYVPPLHIHVLEVPPKVKH